MQLWPTKNVLSMIKLIFPFMFIRILTQRNRLQFRKLKGGKQLDQHAIPANRRYMH